MILTRKSPRSSALGGVRGSYICLATAYCVVSQLNFEVLKELLPCTSSQNGNLRRFLPGRG